MSMVKLDARLAQRASAAKRRARHKQRRSEVDRRRLNGWGEDSNFELRSRSLLASGPPNCTAIYHADTTESTAGTATSIDVAEALADENPLLLTHRPSAHHREDAVGEC
jgi:hypothetical protein